MCRLFSVIVGFALVTATEASGEMISIVGDFGDGTVDVGGLGGSLSAPQIRAGVAGNNSRGQSTIYFFALPTIPSSDAIVEAELQLHFLGLTRATITTPPELNADLFGIGARSSPTILASDYYDGDASLGSDTLIAESFLTPSATTGSFTASGSNLTTFLISLYQPNGIPTAPFAVLRVNPDSDLPVFSGPLRGYELASANHPNPAFVPRLTITVVPEPSTSVTFLGAMAFLIGCTGARRFRQSFL